MEIDAPAQLTLGPVLFNWPVETLRDFYFRIADEAPVDTVYLGEVVCSKRAPFFAPHWEEVAERLAAGGKRVVFSTLAEVMLKLDRKLIDSVCAVDALVEANDAAALYRLAGRPHHIGPFVNCYNEETLAVLAERGATNVCLPVEMPAAAISAMAKAADARGVTLEVQVYGRMPLALSARCYHARAHGRTKDSCQFVCEQDPDGLELTTLDGAPFLAVNGIQTMSQTCLNLVEELPALRRLGVTRFRLSPHSCDMVAVARTFRDALDGAMDPVEASRRLEAASFGAPFANGFFYKKPGFTRVRAERD